MNFQRVKWGKMAKFFAKNVYFHAFFASITVWSGSNWSRINKIEIWENATGQTIFSISKIWKSISFLGVK